MKLQEIIREGYSSSSNIFNTVYATLHKPIARLLNIPFFKVNLSARSSIDGVSHIAIIVPLTQRTNTDVTKDDVEFNFRMVKRFIVSKMDDLYPGWEMTKAEIRYVMKEPLEATADFYLAVPHKVAE